jgi:MFS family permease
MTIGVSSQIGVDVFKTDADTTVVLLSVFALFNAVGRPAFGWMTDRFSPFTAASISLTLVLAASVLLYFSPDRTMVDYIAALSILWLNLGAWLAIAPASVANFFGKRNYSRNYGIVFTAYGLGALIGTPLAEFIKNTYGNYRFIRLAKRLEIHYTPKHGSWLNIAEIELSVLTRQCLGRRMPSIDNLSIELSEWESKRNNIQKAVDWQFSTDDARIKLKRLYPQFKS